MLCSFTLEHPSGHLDIRWGSRCVSFRDDVASYILRIWFPISSGFGFLYPQDLVSYTFRIWFPTPSGFSFLHLQDLVSYTFRIWFPTPSGFSRPRALVLATTLLRLGHNLALNHLTQGLPRDATVVLHHRLEDND